jgi:O-antigen/teichoic acid export membrane protein
MKSNFFYNFLLTGSNLLFPLLTFPYLSRILGANGLGICNFISSYGQNYIIIAALGIPVYGIREIAKVGDDVTKRSKVFFEILTIHLIFTCFILAIYIASLFLFSDFKQYREIALLGGSLIVFNVFSIEWLFSGVNNFRYITTRSLIVRIVSIICIFTFVRKKDDFLIYFIILIVTVFLTASIDVYSARQFITRKITLTFKGIISHIKPVIYLGAYMVLTSIYSVLPSTLLGFFSSKSAVGYYFGANKIIRMVISVFSALITVMVPRLNLIAETKGNKEYLSLISKSLNVIISFGIPIAFFVFLLANPLVMLLAGKYFVNSIFVIQVMTPIIVIVAFAQVFVLLILSVNRKDKEMIILSIIGITISLPINLIFIPHFAEKATAFSQLLAEFFVMIFALYFAKRCLLFQFPLKKLLLNFLCVIPFAAITCIVIKFSDNNVLRLALSGLFCGLYFMYYQIYLIKDRFLIELAEPLRAKFLNIRNK